MRITNIPECPYCKEKAKVIEDKGKYYLECPKCGKKEATKQFARKMMK
jgi:predicted RNA-binding Zn-ribbon protein involved in translation (DUF1610 family)